MLCMLMMRCGPLDSSPTAACYTLQGCSAQSLHASLGHIHRYAPLFQTDLCRLWGMVAGRAALAVDGVPVSLCVQQQLCALSAATNGGAVQWCQALLIARICQHDQIYSDGLSANFSQVE